MPRREKHVPYRYRCHVISQVILHVHPYFHPHHDPWWLFLQFIRAYRGRNQGCPLILSIRSTHPKARTFVCLGDHEKRFISLSVEEKKTCSDIDITGLGVLVLCTGTENKTVEKSHTNSRQKFSF